jgi:hypothetical protein
MLIDVFAADVMSLAEAAKRLPKARNGKKAHVTTIYRWATAGLRSHDDAVFRLETVKVGGTTCTSLGAMQRFFERLSRPTPEPLSSNADTASTAARYQTRKAELRRAGI